MRQTWERLTVGLVFLILTAVVYAAPTTYTASLAGGNENPPTASTGTGTTSVTIDPTAHTLRVQIVFSGLSSITTASHIHCCAVPPTNAGVATSTPSFLGFPVNVTSGTMDMTYDMTQASTWNPAFITANGGTTASAEAVLVAGMAAGQTYLNIHTTNFPSGEIRGNLAAPVPTLRGWMLGGLALLLLAAGYLTLRRRVLTS